MAEEERERCERLRKSLAEFQAQAGRPFEHDARLKELLARQSELNAALDLGKGEDRQVAQPDDGEAPADDSEARGRVPRRSSPPGAASARRNGAHRSASTGQNRRDPSEEQQPGNWTAPEPQPRAGLLP